jgi:RNA polymerase sigma factor (sigma-70 family)
MLCCAASGTASQRTSFLLSADRSRSMLCPCPDPAPCSTAPLAPARRRSAADAQLTALVRAVRAGDEIAWTRLVGQFDRGLRNIARTYRLAPTDIDDVMQATWLRLFKHVQHLHEPNAIAGWLATTTRRECLRLLQRPVREQLTGDERLRDRGELPGPEAALVAADRRAALARALATLPDRQRRLMTLLAAQPDTNYAAISRALDMPIGSIGPIRARGLARLERNVELQSLRPSAG